MFNCIVVVFVWCCLGNLLGFYSFWMVVDIVSYFEGVGVGYNVLRDRELVVNVCIYLYCWVF